MQKILYLILLVSVASFGQSGKVQLNANINNTKTNKHVNIPGTRIYIIPPPNYKVIWNAMVLPEKNIFFKFTDSKESNFSVNAEYRYNKHFEKDGFIILDSMNLKVNGYPATYHLMISNTTLRIYDLIFEDKDFCETIYVNIENPQQYVNGENDIIQALNSIYFDKNSKDAPYETTCFTLNDSTSTFKFFNFKDNTNEKECEYRIKELKYNDKLPFPSVIADGDVMKASDSNDIKILVERTIKDVLKNDKNASIKQSITSIGNNYEAYQLEVNAKIDTINISVYIFFLRCDNKSIVLALIMEPNKDSPYYLQEFNKLVNTIRFKQKN
jgi:hypothetical protein